MNLLSATPEVLARVEAALIGREPQHERASVTLYTLSDAAKKLNVSRNSIYRMLAAGTLRTVELRPGCKRVPEAELVRLAKGGAA